jgi:hypothetical protein
MSSDSNVYVIRVDEVRGPWQESLTETLCEGKSLIASHTREGFVAKPSKERYHHSLGRVILKSVGQGYLLRKEK